MSDPLVVDLFVEDRAHEEFLKPLLRRIAAEEAAAVTARVRSARGGHGRVMDEFKLYPRLVETGVAGDQPDIVVAVIDGNCSSFARKRGEIHTATHPLLREAVVAACPDPHVERWYLADPASFHAVVGHRPAIGRKKCARDHYKRILADSLCQAGHLPTLGGIEFAEELVAAMDLYRAGQRDRARRAFVDDLRGKLRQLRAQ